MKKINEIHLFWAAVGVIIFVQAPHLAFEFRDMSEFAENGMNELAWLHGIFFALAIDACVLIFAMRGNRWATGLFAVISFIITLKYYASGLTDIIGWGSTIMVAAAGVLAVFFLSHEIEKIQKVEKDRSIELARSQGYEDGLEAGRASGEIDTLDRDGVFEFSEIERKILGMKKDKKSNLEIKQDLQVTEEQITSVMEKINLIYQ